MKIKKGGNDMKRFEYDLKREGNEVTFQVLEMDESLRGKDALFEYKGVEIYSVAHPNLTPEVIFLRGINTTADNDIAREDFITSEEAREYYKKIKQTLEVFKLSLIQEEKQDKKENTKSSKDLIDAIRDVVSDVEISIFSDGSYLIKLWKVGVPIILKGDIFCLSCELYDGHIIKDMLGDISKVIDILHEYREEGYCEWL